MIDQPQLESERRFLERQLDALPTTALLTRSSTQARIRQIDKQLSECVPRNQPATARLTFRGRPVVGSHGVFADFGSQATSAFTNAVSLVAAALLGPLASSGPVPNREQCQLLITSTALGSFGFEFEEYRPQLNLLNEETPAARALEVTRGLLQSSVKGTDDELTESISGISPRSIEAVHTFVEVLATNDAICTLIIGENSFRFHDVGEVRRSEKRLSNDNYYEGELTFYGEFQGVLPKGRTFEFKQAISGEIIRGRIGPEVEEPDVLNQHLHKPTTITLIESRVGSAKPKYRLIQIPTWESQV
jgi:hypothetical protein